MNTKTRSQVSLSDDQWNLLFKECHKSGLTIKEWCSQHQINYNCFFYHRRRLQRHADEETSSTIRTAELQEVVDISSDLLPPPCQVTDTLHAPEVGVRLTFHDVSVEIMNSAAGDCIRDTLLALRELC